MATIDDLPATQGARRSPASRIAGFLTRREHRGAVLFAVLSVSMLIAIAAGGDATRHALAYRSDLLETGELWRALSGHFIHFGVPHLLLNAAGLIGILIVYGKVFTFWRWFGLTCGLAVFTSIGFRLFSPDVEVYLGLSGVLHGLMLCAVLCALSRHDAKGGEDPPFDHLFVGGGIILKLAYETLIGPIPLTQTLSQGPVAVQAHLYGGVVGAAIMLVIILDDKWRSV